MDNSPDAHFRGLYQAPSKAIHLFGDDSFPFLNNHNSLHLPGKHIFHFGRQPDFMLPCTTFRSNKNWLHFVLSVLIRSVCLKDRLKEERRKHGEVQTIFSYTQLIFLCIDKAEFQGKSFKHICCIDWLRSLHSEHFHIEGRAPHRHNGSLAHNAGMQQSAACRRNRPLVRPSASRDTARSGDAGKDETKMNRWRNS